MLVHLTAIHTVTNDKGDDDDIECDIYINPKSIRYIESAPGGHTVIMLEDNENFMLKEKAQEAALLVLRALGGGPGSGI